MALKTKKLEALGLDWGTWVYDCESGLSTIIAKDAVRIEIEIDVDVKKLTDGLSQLLPGAAKVKLETAIKALAKKLPKGKLKLFIQIAARAGATDCVAGKRLVHAQVDLIVSFEAEVAIAGGAGKVKGKVTVFESLESFNEMCTCKTDKKLAFIPNTEEHNDSAFINLDGTEETEITSDSREKQEVTIIDSIGSSTAQKLAEAFQISTLGELANANTQLAKRLRVGISEARLKRFKALAGLLLEYPSLTPEGADTLVHGLGIESVEEFVQRAPRLTKKAIRAGVKKAQTPIGYIGNDILALIESV